MQTYAQQEKKYEFLPAPDLWYNDVDGIRVGLRLKGQAPGTFNDGPHRLTSGVWLGTWIPDYPVSYYLSYIEPIPSISKVGAEGSLEGISSLRAGFQQHGIRFNKRWQKGFDERNFRKIRIGLLMEDRFENDYLLYPEMWTSATLYLAKFSLGFHDANSLGRYSIKANSTLNIAGKSPFFNVSSIEIQQHIPLNNLFELRIRNYTALSTNNVAPQYLISRSFQSPRGWMDSGLSRAKGTIPTPWMGRGLFQITGGANLRGYFKQEIQSLNQSDTPAPLLNSIGAVNMEFDYPNPIDNAIQNTPFIGDILSLRSYLFLDTGTSLGFTESEESRLLADGGLGFLLSLNIPDFLANPRGIMIRYDLPLWLTKPADGNHFKFRNIIGIGAVISL